MRQETSLLSQRLAGAQFDLYAFISVLTRGRPETADILQETNLAILSHEADYDSSRPFLPWARGVARHHVLRYYQEKSRERVFF